MRKEQLQFLLEYSLPLHKIRKDLNAYPWDSDQELVMLYWRHVRSVLERYIAGELDKNHLEEWAELIECREDIAFENSEWGRFH